MKSDSVFGTLETRASPDRMEVILSGYLSSDSARSFDARALQQLLEDRGFTARLNPEKAAQICRQLTSGRTVSPLAVAEGTRPGDGEDGRIELHFSNDVDVGEKCDDTGRIDYHTRSMVKAVRSGQLLLEIVKPTSGTPGVDVHGKSVPAKAGKKPTVEGGENVRTSSDGRKLYAEKDGAVILKGNVISVLETVVVESDVDYSTGNIEMPFGSVEIRGNVTNGFSVTSRKDIAVRDVVEDAVLTAGGNVEVRGGVTAKGAGIIKAGGDFRARYLHNARVEAGGDVHLTDGAIQSAITAGGKILVARGKGKVSGGVLKSGEHIEVNEAGAASGVSTRMEIEVGDSRCAQLEEILDALRKEQESQRKILGERSDDEVMAQASSSEREKLASLLAQRRLVSKRIEKIEQALREERQKNLRESSKKRIVVKRQIHAGVVIAIAGRETRVTQSQGPCHFLLDEYTNRVINRAGDVTPQGPKAANSNANSQD